MVHSKAFNRHENRSFTLATEILTQKRLKELLVLDVSSYNFFWLKHRSRLAKPGLIAGCLHKISGYWVITIDRRPYYAHRLVWLYLYGEFPLNTLDHINGNGLDNNIENLRLATQAQNMQNMAIKINNTSGHVGISWDKANQKWHASITCNRKRQHLGFFVEKQDAINAYLLAKKRLHVFQPTPPTHQAYSCVTP